MDFFRNFGIMPLMNRRSELEYKDWIDTMIWARYSGLGYDFLFSLDVINDPLNDNKSMLALGYPNLSGWSRDGNFSSDLHDHIVEDCVADISQEMASERLKKVVDFRINIKQKNMRPTIRENRVTFKELGILIPNINWEYLIEKMLGFHYEGDIMILDQDYLIDTLIDISHENSE